MQCRTVPDRSSASAEASSPPSWRSWPARACPRLDRGEPSIACPTAPSSPTPAGSRPASTSTWSGSKPGNSASPSTSWTTGSSLREDVKALTNHSGSRSYVDIPLYLKGRNGEGHGIGRRQCTDNYKIRPIRRRKIRDLLGTQDPEAAGPRWNHRRALAGNLHRRGHPHEGLPRQVDGEPLPPHRGGHVPEGLPGLVAKARYDRPLERSVCVACPFQSRYRWVETKRRWPELFAEAVEIDARLRDGLAFAKEPYLHTLRMPLAEAVALDEAKLGTDGQRDGFGNECEGHCGV